MKHGRIEITNQSTACVIEVKIFQEAHPDTALEVVETSVWMDYEVFDNLKKAVNRFDPISTIQVIEP